MPVLALAAAVFAAASAHAQQPIHVELRRGPNAPPKIGSYFTALDKVLQLYDETALLLAGQAARPTVSTSRQAASRVRAMAEAYRDMNGDSSALAAADEIAKALEGLTRGLREQDPLPAEAYAKVFSFEAGNLNRWLHLLRQGALEDRGPKGAIAANALVSVNGRSLPVLDIGSEPLVRDGRISSAALRALALVMQADPEAGLEATVLSGRRLWMRCQGADVFADLASPISGGVVRVRYRELGGSTPYQARFYFLTRVLYELGYSVQVENGELSAQMSAGRESLDPKEMGENLALAVKALALAAGLPEPLQAYLEGTSSQDENAQRLDDLARIFAAEGGLPFLDGKRPESLKAGAAEYREKDPEREALRAQMNATLAAFRLGEIPAGQGVGQRTIGRYYNAPIAAALARGEIRLSAGRPERAKGYDPLAKLAKAAASRLRSGAAAEFWPSLGSFKTIGMAGSRVAQRAQWSLDSGRWLILYVLRGAKDGSIEVLEAEQGDGNSEPKPLESGAALAELKELGLVRAGWAEEKAQGDPPPAPEGLFWALAAQRGSSRPIVARITYDRAQAALGGRIYATPYAAPGDLQALRRSQGLLATAGLPTAGTLAAQAGIPALILPQARWSEAGLELEAPSYGALRRTPWGPVRDLASVRTLTLREGDAIRFDPGHGAIEVLSQEQQAFLTGLDEALKAYDRGGDINALALWTIAQLSDAQFSARQKRELAAAIVSAMQGRSKTGVSPSHLERIRAVVKEYVK